MLLLHGYTDEALNTLRVRLQEVRNQAIPIVRLCPRDDGVCGLDMVDIAYRLYSQEALKIFAQKSWFNETDFDPESLTVGQVLSVWDDLLNLTDIE